MGSIDWGDVLRGSLSVFLILAGVGILFVCIKLGALLGRLGRTVGSMTDEIVPILNRAQGTVDGINLELARVDEIMVTAVNATKGAEKTVTTLSHAAVAPVKKASGLAAAAKEALATFRARRQAGPDEADLRAAEVPSAPAPTSSPTPLEVREQYVAQAAALREKTALREKASASVAAAAADAHAVNNASAAPASSSDPFAGRVSSAPSQAAPKAPEPPRSGPKAPDTPKPPRRGPSASMIEWALPKKKDPAR